MKTVTSNLITLELNVHPITKKGSFELTLDLDKAYKEIIEIELKECMLE